MKVKMQQDVRDCGLAILQGFYRKFYKKWISINEFKKEAFYNVSGISLANLELVATKFGMHFNSFEGDFASLEKLEVDQPFIILINSQGANHYVILRSINHKGDFEIIDPMTGIQIVPKNLMSKIFLNSIAIVQKQKNYQVPKFKNNTKAIMGYLINYLSIAIIINSILGSMLLIVSSFYMKIIFDKVIKNESYALLIYIFCIFCLLLLFKLWNDFLKSYFIKKLNLQIEQKITTKYAHNLATIDLEYIAKITNNDNLRRINLIPSIADFIANFIFSIMAELIIFCFAFLMLLMINLQLFLVVSIGSLIIITFSYFYQKFITRNYQKVISNNLSSFSMQMNLVQNVANLKQKSARNFYLNNFFGKHFEKKKLEFKLFKWNLLNNFVFGLISQFIPLLIIFLGVILYFQKQTSFGNVLVFIAFFGFYLTPLKSFIEILLKLPIFKSDYQHLNFILNVKKEKQDDNQLNIARINSIHFQNYFFSFDNYKKVFHIKDLEIKKSLKLTGKNGSGKSTFLKSIALQNYASGKCLINNVDRNNISWQQIRTQILYINTNDFIPSCTIFSFITQEEEKQVEQFMKNYKAFELEKVFINFNLSLGQLMEDNGSNLSSGQRQMIYLMKIFTQEFAIIMLDETFENIDHNSLKLLQEKILKFQQEAIFIEVSHNEKFISNGKKVNFESL